MKITKYTNLVVVLQHLSDYSDLWMVVLDWYNPGEGQRVATNSVIHKHKIFLLLKKKKILIISDHLNLFVVSPHEGKLLDVTDSCSLAQNLIIFKLWKGWTPGDCSCWESVWLRASSDTLAYTLVIWVLARNWYQTLAFTFWGMSIYCRTIHISACCIWIYKALRRLGKIGHMDKKKRK